MCFNQAQVPVLRTEVVKFCCLPLQELDRNAEFFLVTLKAMNHQNVLLQYHIALSLGRKENSARMYATQIA